MSNDSGRYVAVLGSILLMVSLMGAAATPSDLQERELVLVEISALNVLERAEVDILERYDNFALIRAEKSLTNRLKAMGIQVDTLPGRTIVYAGGERFDFTEGEPEMSDTLRLDGYEQGTEGLYIVHMLGPISSGWRRALDEMDVQVLNYVSNHAYRVRMTPEKAREVEELEFIDWVGIYHPHYKLRSDLEPGLLRIGTVPDGEALSDIRRKASVISYVERVDGSFSIIAEVNRHESFQKIARLNDVLYIKQYTVPELHDEISTQHIAGGSYFFDDEDDDPETAYRKHGEYGSYMTQLGYSGKGVVTAIADTGIGNGTVGDAGHPDFTGRVIGGYSYSGGWADGHGHGTHCAGSVGGDTYHGTEDTFYNDYYSAVGTAPETEFYAVKIFNSAGSYIGPSDPYHIAQVAKQNADAYVHSNSWGAAVDGAYDELSEAFDRAVRDSDPDSDGNQPMIVTTSAGNSGSSDQTIGSPATGKNVISVGATQRYPNDPEEISSFSSRGWTQDNRIKPDVVAPGSQIYSTTPDGGYQYMSGTSMSNPAVAGAAAVVVEWYEENYGEKPSPAMVRSLLINTANQIDGNTRGSIPNQDEGWGMVDISKLERPIDDPIQFYLEDQTSIFTDSLQEEEHLIQVDRTDEPLKITLVWTDEEAPEDTGDSRALINDLNLEVESPCGVIYRGNAFSGGWTQAGEDAMSDFDTNGDGWDNVNNVQNVYIPPDEVEDGVYSVRVRTREIAGDAINLGHPSQDYALVAYNALEEIPGEPPEVTVLSPDGGEVWEVDDEEFITWETEEGDDPIDSIRLSYSIDEGISWNCIEPELDDTGEYLWNIPNDNSDQCLVKVRVIDSMGRIGEDVSEGFEIIGEPPHPPEDLSVEYFGQELQILFEDEVESGDLGYVTDRSHDEASAWLIRDTGAAVGDHSWDWGDGEFAKDPNQGMLSWSITPEIDIPPDADEEHGVLFTFQHWRDFGDGGLFDAGNVKISTEGTDGPWEVIVPDGGYDGTVPDAFDNPLGGEEAYGGTRDWEKATFDLIDHAGESIHLRWDAGTEAWDGLEGAGWRVDDIYVEALVEDDDGTEHNLLTWNASPDDPEEVCHYNVYRSDTADGPWDESTLIASVEAEAALSYELIDRDKGSGDDISWWYVVRAVGTNGLEEMNTYAVVEPGSETKTYDIPLHSGGSSDGWNFVSFNLVPSDSSLLSIIEDPDKGISGNYDSLIYHDASTDEVLTYTPKRADHFNDLESWDHTMGVWIRMTADDVLTVEGHEPTETTITLYEGWNMVSYAGSEAGTGVPDEVTEIGYFDASEEYNVAYTEDVDNFEFSPGEGYWLYAEQEVDWIVEY